MSLKIYILFCLYIQILLADFSVYSPEIKTMNFNDGKFTNFAVIGDMQLSTKYSISNAYQKFASNYKHTLEYLKNKKLDFIVFVGDITDDGESSSYELFNKLTRQFYPKNKSNNPYFFHIMGNHDLSGGKNFFELRQKIFFDHTGSYPNSHYIINGFHFIFWSHDTHYWNETFGYMINDTTWIEKEIEKAISDIKQKGLSDGTPIFVFSHAPPINTVYGSKKQHLCGSTKTYEILKKYSNIINISGHTHYSMNNELTIWQGEFTALSAGSISYVNYEYNRTNANYDPYNFNKAKVNYNTMSKYNNYNGLYISLTKNYIKITRENYAQKKIIGKKWTIKFPLKISEFNFNTKTRIEMSAVPKFDKLATISYYNNTIKFPQAKPINFIHEYEIKLIERNSKNNKKKPIKILYFSDFLNLNGKRSKTMELNLNKYIQTYKDNEINNNEPKLSNGIYSIEIVAKSNYGKKSKVLKGLIEINKSIKHNKVNKISNEL